MDVIDVTSDYVKILLNHGAATPAPENKKKRRSSAARPILRSESLHENFLHSNES